MGLQNEFAKADGFREAAINFPPSYPFYTKRDQYDPDIGEKKKKGRTVSYCDRILFKWQPKQTPVQAKDDDCKEDESEAPIKCKGYGMYRDVKGSDHRPVYADFEIDLAAAA